MTRLLDIVPLWMWLAVAGVGLATAGHGLYLAGANSEIAKHAKEAQDLRGQIDKARQERAALKDTQDKDRERVAGESFAYSEKLRADADSSRDALERMRISLARARTSSAAAHQGASAPAGRPTADTFAELFGSCASELRQMGEDADRDHAAGLKCERTYDTLTTSTAEGQAK